MVARYSKIVFPPNLESLLSPSKLAIPTVTETNTSGKAMYFSTSKNTVPTGLIYTVVISGFNPDSLFTIPHTNPKTNPIRILR